MAREQSRFETAARIAAYLLVTTMVVTASGGVAAALSGTGATAAHVESTAERETTAPASSPASSSPTDGAGAEAAGVGEPPKTAVGSTAVERTEADRSPAVRRMDHGAVPVRGGPTGRALSGFAPGATLADAGGSITLSGKVVFRDRGQTLPARQVSVVVRDQNNVNHKLAETTTDDRGRFTVTFDESDFGAFDRIGSLPDVKVQAFAYTPGMKVKSNLLARAYRTTKKGISVSPGVRKNVGTITPNTALKHRAFKIADAGLEAYRYTRDRIGATRSQVRVIYPANAGPVHRGAFFSKVRIPAGKVARTTVFHEYGHSYQMAAMWNNNALRTTTETSGTDHVDTSETDPKFAFKEGFAEFFAYQVQEYVKETRSRKIHDDDSFEDPDGGDNFYNQAGASHHPGDTGDMDGHKVEGSVAALLRDLTDRDATDGDDDGFHVSMAGLMRLSNDDLSPGNRDVTNVNELWGVIVKHTSPSPSERAALRKVYFDHGIAKPDRFEANDLRAAATDLSGKGPVVKAQITWRDRDYYRLQVDSKSTLHATVTQQTTQTDVSLALLDGSGNRVATSDTGGDREAVSAVVPSGTYYLRVEDLTTGSTPYNLFYGTSAAPAGTDEENDDENAATSINSHLAEPGSSNGWESSAVLAGGFAPGDPDYYAITLSPGEAARIDVDQRARKRGDLTGWDLLWTKGVDGRTISDGEVRIANDDDRPRTWYVEIDRDTPIQKYVVDVSVRGVSTADEENDDTMGATELDGKLASNPPSIGTSSVTVNGGYGPGDPDKYEFDLAPGESVRIDLDRPDGSPVTAWDVVNVGAGLKVVDPGNDGELHVVNDEPHRNLYYLRVGSNDPTDAPIREYTVDATFERVVAKHEDNDDRSAATDLGSRLSSQFPSGANQWWAGAYVRGGLESGDSDYYAVTLDRGDHLRAALRTDGRMDLSLSAPGGRTVERIGPGETISWTAKASGTYYLRAEGGTVPEYWLRVGVTDAAGYDRLEPNDLRSEATRVPDGADTFDGAERTYSDLAVAGSDDVFAVELVEGQRLNATLIRRTDPGLHLSVEGPGNPQPEWSLRGDDSRHVRFDAPENGTYYLTVSGVDGATTGTYDLSVRTGAEVSLPVWTGGAGDAIGDVTGNLSGVGVVPRNDSDAGCGDDTRRFEGQVDAGAEPVEAFVASVDGTCPVRVTLTAEDADLDLYVTLDGRTPSEGDYDRRSAGAGPTESVVLSPDELDSGSIAAAVRAYAGESEFTLVVEELDRDG